MDGRRSRRPRPTFYGHVVGWKFGDPGMAGFPYKIGAVEGYGVVGMMTIPAEAKAMGAPPCWTGYVWVEDVDAAAAKLKAAGGRVMREPMDIPNVGRFAIVTDAQGAPFALFRDAGGNPPPASAAGDARVSSVGANCTPPTARRRSSSTPASSAGRRRASSTWGRWASTACSTSAASRAA